jgi:hypothetical protein
MTTDTDIVRAALAKFNQNKNAKHFEHTLQPGVYPVEATFTLLGSVRRGQDTTYNRRDDSGSKHIVQYLLDVIDEDTYNALARNIDTIRRGKYPLTTNTARLHGRMAAIMPLRERKRTGPTTFTGDVILEDLDLNPLAIPNTPNSLTVYGF